MGKPEDVDGPYGWVVIEASLMSPRYRKSSGPEVKSRMFRVGVAMTLSAYL
ncbi:hypothetical protein [Deinococcus sp.]|uniref:hypothetical protein n=1 Tax=Deinococcus sp. TaxID=47478 RepID=UPI003CC5D898